MAARQPIVAADRIHRDAVVWVVHDHFHHRLDANLGMRDGGVTAKTLVPVGDLAIYNDSGAADHLTFYRRTLEQVDGWAVESLVRLERARRLLESRPDRFLVALHPDDVLRAKREGKAAVFLGLEGCKAFEGRLELVHAFHRLGVRQAQLVWAHPNQLVETADGQWRLSGFGRECIAAMNDLGIVVDLAHAPMSLFAEVVRLSRRPVVVSHGAPTAPHPGSGDMTHEHLQMLKGCGGLLGLHFCRHYINGPFATFEDFLETLDWLVGAGYGEQIALGGDLFEVDAYFRARHPAPAGSTHATWQPFIPELGEVACLPDLTRALVARGYCQPLIRAILGENVLRVYRAVVQG
ncbi:MAG: membrane dipeptidase [Candidatus Latescibacterota bacterium]